MRTLNQRTHRKPLTRLPDAEPTVYPSANSVPSASSVLNKTPQPTETASTSDPNPL
jgi:hypothetical protein